MRYPNLRYGNPAELRYYITSHGGDVKHVARMLRRDERTVRDWMNGKRRVPWWVPEIMRLKRQEADDRHRQMFGHGLPPPLAVVTHGAQLELRRAAETKKPQMIDLRLDDFDSHSAVR
ncbi:MAG: hypothetical protein V4724_41060 [Pseudomonadota bacterium]